jgi:hypothetical protein
LEVRHGRAQKPLAERGRYLEADQAEVQGGFIGIHDDQFSLIAVPPPESTKHRGDPLAVMQHQRDVGLTVRRA